ncbi:MAG: NrdH-redoxin, partial [Alphaproteobacteria bacterium]|nr:NrdH-redoxin [Alphaproteobacteria bacterium]
MSARAVDFQSINVAADPDGLAQLQKLGVRTVPVVARGERYVMGLSLRDVGEFLGLDDQGPGMLPPAQLVQRLDRVLNAAQRYLRQLPDDLMTAELPGRARSYRDLTYHIFQIARAFLGVASGEELTYQK